MHVLDLVVKVRSRSDSALNAASLWNEVSLKAQVSELVAPFRLAQTYESAAAFRLAQTFESAAVFRSDVLCWLTVLFQSTVECSSDRLFLLVQGLRSGEVSPCCAAFALLSTFPWVPALPSGLAFP